MRDLQGGSDWGSQRRIQFLMLAFKEQERHPGESVLKEARNGKRAQKTMGLEMLMKRDLYRKKI